MIHSHHDFDEYTPLPKRNGRGLALWFLGCLIAGIIILINWIV